MPDVPRQAAPSEPHGRIDPKTSATTRHLSAGAYLDRNFRDRILGRIFHRTDRALAPDPGVDTALVLHHANTSWTLDAVQHSIASAIMVFIVVTSLPALTLPRMITLIAWALIGLGLQRSSTADARDQPSLIPMVVGGAIIAGLLFFAGPLIQTVLFATGTSTSEPRTGLLWFWLALLTIVSVGFGMGRAAKLNAIGENRTTHFHDERILRIRRIQGAAACDVVNYSAHRSPFVGAGKQITTWQFAMPLRPNLKRGAVDHTDPTWPHFTAAKLNEHVRTAISALANDRGHSRHLPGLELIDRFYVSGKDTETPAHHLNDLRNAGLPSTAAAIQGDPTGPVRHYLCCQAASWDGELVTSIFIHTALQGETLYMEFHSYLLPPTRESYHVFGRRAPTPEARLALAGVAGLAGAPLLLVTGPMGVVRAATTGLRNWRERTSGSDDVGARTNIRELGSDLGPHSYFQGRDSIKYTEILEAQLLGAVLEFLDDKADTSRLSGFTDTIVNHGIINYGNAGAIGDHASATIGSVGTKSRGSVEK